jgi:hypothetical protein
VMICRPDGRRRHLGGCTRSPPIFSPKSK